VQEPGGKGAQNGFVAKGRAILAMVKPPGVAETDYDKYVLRFVEEVDVDPIATRSLWKSGVKEGAPDFLKRCVEPRLAQCILAFRGPWPADAPLPIILTHRLIQALGEMGDEQGSAALVHEQSEPADQESLGRY